MSDLSFEETTQALAKKRKISYEEASLLVAERYGDLIEIEEDEDSVEFDDPLTIESIPLYTPPSMKGLRVLRLDEDLSPRYAIHRQQVVGEAKREGDRYRSMSRMTSMHEGM